MKNLLVIISALLITACGWHLRGSDPSFSSKTKWETIAISADDEHTALFTHLRPSLNSYRLTENTSATNRLELQNLELDKRTAGVGADALTNAYELTLHVEYRLETQPESIGSFTKASVTRTYNYNLNNANGATQEEALILREMHRELAQQILRRTRILLNKPTAQKDHG